jgi:hypothetical protein
MIEETKEHEPHGRACEKNIWENIRKLLQKKEKKHVLVYPISS